MSLNKAVLVDFERFSRGEGLSEDVLDLVQKAELKNPEVARAVLGLTVMADLEIGRGRSGREKNLWREIGRLRDFGVRVLAATMPERIWRPKEVSMQLESLREIVEAVGKPKDLDWFRAMGLKMSGVVEGHELLTQVYMKVAKWMLKKEIGGFVWIKEERKKKKEKSVLAESLVKGLAKVEEKHGAKQIINYVVEAAITPKDAQAVKELYIDLIKAGAKSVAIKPTAIVPLSTSAAAAESNLPKLTAALVEILQAASGKDVRVELDSEWSGLLGLTTKAFFAATAEVKDVYAVIATQAYDERAEEMVVKPLIKASRLRVMSGGKPLFARLVCGANLLAEEQMRSENGWESTMMVKGEIPRAEAHANYHRLLKLLIPELKKGHVGVVLASMNLQTQWWNLIELAKAGALKRSNGLLSMAMLRGMGGPETFRFFEQRYGRKLEGVLDFWEYVPAIAESDLVEFFAYYTRRMDEIGGGSVAKGGLYSAIANWLGVVSKYGVGSKEWRYTQVELGILHSMQNLDKKIKREGDKIEKDKEMQKIEDFKLIPRWDLRTESGQKWGSDLLKACRDYQGNDEVVRLDWEGERTVMNLKGRTLPGVVLKRFELATKEDVDEAFRIAKEDRGGWAKKSAAERIEVILRSAELTSERRCELNKSLILNVGKTILEAEGETDEAIEFNILHALYLRKFLAEHEGLEVFAEGNGTAVVICPKNFPAAIPVAHIVARLLAGYRVIVKPSGGEREEAIWPTYEVVKALWDSGVPREALIFLPCDNKVAAYLSGHKDCERLGFTGSTFVAEKIWEGNPQIEMIAETGGRNVVVVDGTVDLKVFAKQVVPSIVGFAGQKCSKPVAILATSDCDIEKLKELMVGVMSQMLCAMATFGKHVDCTPLSKVLEKGSALYEAMTKLRAGEEWLFVADAPEGFTASETPRLKFVKDLTVYDFAGIEEVFGPICTIVPVDGGVDEALAMLKLLPGTLTGAMWTERREVMEKAIGQWQVGQLYINKKPTGALASAQFGDGFGDSHRGMHGAPTGSMEFVVANCGIRKKSGGFFERKEKREERKKSNELIERLVKEGASEELTNGMKSCLWWMENYFNVRRPMPHEVIGEKNFLESRPVGKNLLRVCKGDQREEALMKVFAAKCSGNEVVVSVEEGVELGEFECVVEDEAAFIERMKGEKWHHVTFVSRGSVSDEVYRAACEKKLYVDRRAVAFDGFVDMMAQFRVQSMTVVTHHAGDDCYEELRATPPSASRSEAKGRK